MDPELLAIQQSVKHEDSSNKSVDAKVEILVNPKRYPVTSENTDYDKPIKFIIKAVSTVHDATRVS